MKVSALKQRPPLPYFRIPQPSSGSDEKDQKRTHRDEVLLESMAKIGQVLLPELQLSHSSQGSILSGPLDPNARGQKLPAQLLAGIFQCSSFMGWYWFLYSDIQYRAQKGTTLEGPGQEVRNSCNAHDQNSLSDHSSHLQGPHLILS